MTAEWRDRASCQGRSDINWFPDADDREGLARAVEVCRYCPVKVECAEHARTEPEYHGVWGGVSLVVVRRRVKSEGRMERKRRAKERLAIRGPMSGPDDPRHGTLHGYTNLGCKCDRCSAQMSRYNRDRPPRREAG